MKKLKKVEIVFIIIITILCIVLIIISVDVIHYLLNPKRSFSPSKVFIMIYDVTFQPGTATIYVTNTIWPFPSEDWKVSISGVTVDGVTKPILATGGDFTGSGPYELGRGDSGTITISLSWTRGTTYSFAVTTVANHLDVWNYEGPYNATAF